MFRVPGLVKGLGFRCRVIYGIGFRVPWACWYLSPGVGASDHHRPLSIPAQSLTEIHDDTLRNPVLSTKAPVSV